MKNNCNFKNIFSAILLAILAIRLQAGSITNLQKIITDTVQFDYPNAKLLHLHNVNTNVEVLTWNEDKIVVIYNLSYTASSEKLINQMHQNFDCSYQAGKGILNLGWPMKNGQVFQNGMRVNGKDYVHVNASVRMFVPASLARFEFNGSFGNLSISKYKGISFFDCEYGNIICDSMGPVLLLKNTFGNTTISHCKSIDSINVQYGNLQLFQVQDIRAIYHSFGRFDVAESPGLHQLNLQYSEAVTIKNISDSMLLHSNFSNVNLYLPSSISDLEIEATYGKLMLHMPDTMNYSLNLSTEYGQIVSEHIKLLSLNSGNPYVKLMRLGSANRILSKSVQGHFCDILVKP